MTGMALAAVAVGRPSYAQTNVNSSGDDPIVVIRPVVDAAAREARAALRKGPPPLRGFRAAVGATTGPAWPLDPPGAGRPAWLREAESLVGHRLSRDGLPAMVGVLVDQFGEELAKHPADDQRLLLREAGLPVDLLACFKPPAPDEAAPLLQWAMDQRKGGAKGDALAARLRSCSFQWAPALPGYCVSLEDGRENAGIMRLQMPEATFDRGAGDGSALDVLQQMVAQAPEADFIVSIEQSRLDAFLAAARRWPLGRPRRMTVIAEPQPVGTWAQDNGKPGVAPAAGGGAAEAVTLAPRFANLGEETAVFLPDDTFVLNSLALARHRVVQSPLVFQGGNLLAFRRPKDGKNILLIGESAVHHNTALGLTHEQVVEAFRVEFGVDQCEVLPAASFHVDFEVCIRVVGDEVLAFVNDEVAAARVILPLGVSAIQQAGLTDAAWASEALTALDKNDGPAAVRVIGGRVLSFADASGKFSEGFARVFARDAVESPSANLKRFLMAMDEYAAAVMPEDQMPADALFRTYMATFRRRAADRETIRTKLVALGCRVVAVPSTSDTDRSINYLNGIHAPGRYYMPVYGGFYRPLDDAATEAFRRAMGTGVKIIPIRTAASQEKLGALHCLVSTIPKNDQ